MSWRLGAAAVLAVLVLAGCGGGDGSSAPDQPSYPDTSYQQDSAAYDALNQGSQAQFDAQLNTARSLTP